MSFDNNGLKYQVVYAITNSTMLNCWVKKGIFITFILYLYTRLHGLTEYNYAPMVQRSSLSKCNH